MILKAHFFCKNGNSTTLYPSDSHISTIANKAYSMARTDYQVVVHRDGGLMYYFFFHRTAQETIGLGFSSGKLCVNIKPLYNLFCNFFDVFAQRGVLLCYKNNGGITVAPNGENDTGEVNAMLFWLQNHSCEDIFWEQMPPEDYTLPKGATIYYNFEESSDVTIVEATRHYSYVVVTMKNPIPTSYSETVRRLSSEAESLIKDKEELSNQLEIIKKKKKQYELVIGLAITMFIGALFFIAVISYKNSKIKHQVAIIQDNEATIENQGNTISSQSNTINQQTQSISLLEERVADLEVEKEELESEISTFISDRKALFNHKPFTVTNTSFSFENGLLKVYYYAPSGGTTHVRCRVIQENDETEVFDDSYTLLHSLSSGTGEFTLSIYAGLSSSQWYRFEIYSNGKLCGGGRH